MSTSSTSRRVNCTVFVECLKRKFVVVVKKAGVVRQLEEQTKAQYLKLFKKEVSDLSSVFCVICPSLSALSNALCVPILLTPPLILPSPPLSLSLCLSTYLSLSHLSLRSLSKKYSRKDMYSTGTSRYPTSCWIRMRSS